MAVEVEHFVTEAPSYALVTWASVRAFIYEWQTLLLSVD